MATPPTVSTTRQGVCSEFYNKFQIKSFFQDSLADDDLQNGDHVQGNIPPPVIQSSERIITPIQPPLQPGAPVRQQPTGGFTSTPNSANPTFTVLRATTLQLAVGHPLAYVRVLMQVSD
jgi:hypothetical protein